MCICCEMYLYCIYTECYRNKSNDYQLNFSIFSFSQLFEVLCMLINNVIIVFFFEVLIINIVKIKINSVLNGFKYIIYQNICDLIKSIMYQQNVLVRYQYLVYTCYRNHMHYTFQPNFFR